MSLKALAREALERNCPRNSLCNQTEIRATLPATTAGDAATAVDARLQESSPVPSPAAWVDGFASLEAMAVPRGVDANRWLATMGAAKRFLDAWGGTAHALGWSAAELFGLDADAPLGRLDRRGAAFFLADAEVMAITGELIKLQVGGNIQSIRRRDGFAIPAWENPS